MVSYATILGATLPVFLIMAAGFGLRRLGRLPAAGDATIISLMVNVTYPCYILNAVVVSPALREAGNVIPPVLCGAFFVLAGLLAGWVVAPCRVEGVAASRMPCQVSRLASEKRWGCAGMGWAC